MSSFKYKIKDKSGKTLEGFMDGEDVRSVVARLQQQGCFVLDVREVQERPRITWNPFALFIRWFVNPIFAGSTVHDQAVFYRQFAIMVKSGMTLVQAVSSLRSQGGNRRLRKIADETLLFLQEGGRLSDALARYPWMFPELQISLLRAGEEGGSMDLILDRIAAYLEREVTVRQKLRIATLYPKLLVLAVIFIPPLPALVLEGTDAYLKSITRVVPLVVWLLALWVVYRLLYQIHWFRYAIDMVKLAIPKIGKMTRMLALSKFYRVLSGMFAAGIPIAQSISHAANASGNGFLAARIKTAIPSVERGELLSESLERARGLPPMALDMLRTGEQTGNVDEMLDKAAEYTENEAEVAVMQSTIMLGVLLLLGVALYIGSIVVGFWGGYAKSIKVE